MCAINDAVVLLPFVPVTAIVVMAGSSPNQRFRSEVICTPLLRAPRMSSRYKPTPGDLTTMSISLRVSAILSGPNADVTLP